MPSPHSDLPIVTPDLPHPPRSQTERYGSLYILSIVGLMVVLALLGYFAVGVWSMRDLWTHVYAVNDPSRPIAERLDAAYQLSQNPQVTQRQYYDLALSKTPPDLARYLLAESLTSEAVTPDPRGYALAVARSEGWPDWLRLLLLRPMAYAVLEHVNLPAEPLEELRKHEDPFIALWATYVLASMTPKSEDSEYAQELARSSSREGPQGELAKKLRATLILPRYKQRESLNEITHWLRDHHDGAKTLWNTWSIEGGHLVPAPLTPVSADVRSP